MRSGPRPAALLAAVAALPIVCSAAVAAYRIPPRSDHAVHDHAGVILQEDRQAMESLAREVWTKSRVAIVAVTIKSLEGEVLEELTLRWGREWGIGGNENRGILVLVAVGDHRVRIENGFGVEGYLPDGLVGAILDEEALPHFRRGDFSVGLRRVVERLALLTSREYGFELTGKVSSRVPRSVLSGGAVLVVLLALMILLAGGAPSLLWWLLLGRRRPGRRGPPWYLRGGGGLGGGFGGFGGGGLRGGGFGGFGGGSFGGGGASRGW